MCGIVGAVSRRDVVPLLIEGLLRLEYRGYDSAGLVILDDSIRRVRAVGRVAEMQTRAGNGLFTQREGLALAAAHLSRPRHDYVSRLVGVWQHAVYGHEAVSGEAVRGLCEGFAPALDRAATAVPAGKASA